MKKKNFLQRFKQSRKTREKTVEEQRTEETPTPYNYLIKKRYSNVMSNFVIEGERSENNQYLASSKRLDFERGAKVQFYASKKVESRKEALEGLAAMFPKNKSAFEAFELALDDPEPEIRLTAANELAAYRGELPDKLLQKLIARVWDPDIEVRKAVARALASHPTPHSLGPLLGLLGTPDDELREIVYESILEICEKLGPPPPRADGDV